LLKNAISYFFRKKPIDYNFLDFFWDSIIFLISFFQYRNFLNIFFATSFLKKFLRKIFQFQKMTEKYFLMFLNLFWSVANVMQIFFNPYQAFSNLSGEAVRGKRNLNKSGNWSRKFHDYKKYDSNFEKILKILNFKMF